MTLYSEQQKASDTHLALCSAVIVGIQIYIHLHLHLHLQCVAINELSKLYLFV
jgi:hypothetical protein